MADQETRPIGLETQNKVAGAKDAIRTFFDSPEFQTLLDDVYDEGYEAAGKDAQGENEGEEPR